MIYIDGEQLQNIAMSGTRFQSVLSMIQGGLEWLSWAIKDKTSSITAGNEDQLLTMIQLGLQADEYIRFNTFRTSIGKILTMPDTAIEKLAGIRKTLNDDEEDQNLREILQRNQLFSYVNINETTGFVQSAVADRPDLFQAPSFSDLLAIAAFVQQQKAIGDEAKSQSYSFACNNAATIPDFINLCYFFQDVLQNQLPENLIPITQNSEIQTIYKQLLPLTNYLLYTPSAGTIRSEKVLRDIIPALARTHKFIGYLTGTSAALNLARNLQVNGQLENSLQTQVDNYLSAVKNLVSFTPSSGYHLSQDGKMATLRFEKDQALAMIGVDETGNVFLLPDTKINLN